MDAEKVRIYDACDRAIKEMDRENLRDFGRLKTSKFDELNVVREVTKLYRNSAKKAKKKYYEVAFEAYLLGLAICGVSGAKAQEMATKAITMDWVDKHLESTDFVTLYRFDSETDRKAYRLVEALGATQNQDAEIDKALRIWAKQLGQYAINFTDYAVLQAYMDDGVKEVVWLTAADERVCEECRELDGMTFPIEEVPPKPHWGCRCRLAPA